MAEPTPPPPMKIGLKTLPTAHCRLPTADYFHDKEVFSTMTETSLRLTQTVKGAG